MARSKKGGRVDDSVLKNWRKRVKSAKATKTKWEQECRVDDCYSYWRGDQRSDPLDEFGARRAIVNKIHPEVKNSLPSLYFYRPFARLTSEPERADDPGSLIEQRTQLLQDTANHLVRDPDVGFRDATFLALKEAHWSMGMVEVGYSADFIDAPGAPRPDLKETDKTKTQVKAEPSDAQQAIQDDAEAQAQQQTMQQMASPPSDIMAAAQPPPPDQAAPIDPEMAALQTELKQLQGAIQERFFVKFIPCEQVLVSTSDKASIMANDWIGYWEDLPLEDVKACKSYKNTDDLKPSKGDDEMTKPEDDSNTDEAEIKTIRVYRIWDLRSFNKLVFTPSGEKFLLVKKFDRCPLKPLRFDVDPYHFYPRPPILSKLGPQDEYNDSREYLRLVRKGTVPRYTYDQEAIEAEKMRQLESGAMGTFIPRKGGTVNPIEPVQQPSYSENAVQTLTLSDKEMQDVGGIGGDARVAQSKTATQAKIAEAKTQAQDSFERLLVAEWLGEIITELLALAIEQMRLERWIAINVPADSQYQQQIGQSIAQTFQSIDAQKLSDASNGLRWTVIVDVDSLSPVSEEEKLQKWMQALNLIANPQVGQLMASTPAILKHTLELMGLRDASQQGMIAEGVQHMVMMQQQMAAMGQNAAKGQPSAPRPQPNHPQPAGPHPAAPAGPPAPPSPPPGA